jgi:hypothetical protein
MKKGLLLWAFGKNHCSSNKTSVSQPQGKASSPLEKPSSGPHQPTKQRLYWVPVWKSCKSPAKQATEPIERRQKGPNPSWEPLEKAIGSTLISGDRGFKALACRPNYNPHEPDEDDYDNMIINLDLLGLIYTYYLDNPDPKIRIVTKPEDIDG